MRKHERKAEKYLGGSPRELAKQEVQCEEHSFGFYEKGGNVGRACENCGIRKSKVDDQEPMWLSKDDLPESFETFNRGSVKSRHEQSLQREKEYREAELDDVARRIAKNAIKSEAVRLTPDQGGSSAEWKQAFESASHSDSWAMIKRSYMKSDAWRQRRDEKAKALSTDHCAARLPGCDDTFDHLHHKSYDNIGCEPLWDLAPVCHNCHSIIHGEKPPPSHTQASERLNDEKEKTDLPF